MTNQSTPPADNDARNAETGHHLHLDDYPATLELLNVVLRSKLTTLDGYNPTEHGAWINWDRLATSGLSSTEIGVVHIARGIAVLEHHDGPPPHLCDPVRDAIAAVTEPPDCFGQLDDEPS